MSETEPAPALRASATRGPVTVSLEAPRRGVARGETVELTLTIALSPGARIGSVAPRGPGRRATDIQIGAAEGLQPGAITAPEDSVDPLGGGRVDGYAGTIRVRVPLTIAPDCLPGPAPIAARVLFQADENGRMLAPEQVEVHTSVEVGPS